jgi:starch-binding outer membrane protein, SusD/RagB family
MKKLIFIAVIFFSLSSCKKWLDIAPKSEIASTKLFESEQGFKDALMGSYLLMTSRNTYGFESTIGFVDFLAQQYFIPGTTQPYYYASLYQYDHISVIPKKDNIWFGNYNVISNLNNIIENIDVNKSTLNPANYALIKGESVGLRAFLHFDLLRLFGYGNLVNDPSSLAKKALPYVTRYSKALTIPSTVAVFIDSLKKDLNTAASLLAPYDSLRTGSNPAVPNTDLFYTDRKLRFNYYAVKATQARLYLWLGEYDNAVAAANEVITKGRQYLVSFNNGNINDPNPINKDYAFSTEHIFGLNVQGLYDIVMPYITRYAPDGINVNSSRFNQNGTVADNLYEIATKPNMSLSDYRYKELYNKISTTDYLLLKFTYVDKSTFKDKMPLIKLPEMYYILAEASNEKGSPATAVGFLNTVRINRGISSTYNLSSTLTKDEVTNEIEKEYRKEFVSEGQLFYYYKRRGKTSIVGTSKAMNNSVYVLPLPQREIEMGVK